MTFPLWQPIPERTWVKELLDTSILIHADDPSHGVVATFHIKDQSSGVTMQYARTPNLDTPTSATFGPIGIVSACVSTVFSEPNMRIVAIPPVEWKQPGAGLAWRTPAVGVASLATIAGCLAVGTAFTAAAAIPLAALVGWLLWLLLRRQEPTHIRTAGDLHLDGGNIVEYAQQRALGERPEMRRLEDRRHGIDARAESIKSEYGRLLSDIVYRIDNSALFDSSVPTTERFQTALLVWDDRADASLDELDALAADLEISFAVAKDNAETLGLFHLPETARSDARRASKAARLAADSANEGERNASLHQLSRILDSLALYYLPRVTGERSALDSPHPDVQ